MKFSYNGKTKNDVVQLRKSMNSKTFFFLDGMSTPAGM